MHVLMSRSALVVAACVASLLSPSRVCGEVPASVVEVSSEAVPSVVTGAGARGTRTSSSGESSDDGGTRVSSSGAEAASEPEPEPEPARRVVDFGYPRQAFGDDHAHGDGSMVEWMPGYYIAHSWSGPGEDVLGLEVGDEVRVGGYDLVVSWVGSVSEHMPYEDIRASVTGVDVICFQTCIEGTSENRMVSARPQDGSVLDFSRMPDGRSVFEPSVEACEEVVESDGYVEDTVWETTEVSGAMGPVPFAVSEDASSVVGVACPASGGSGSGVAVLEGSVG